MALISRNRSSLLAGDPTRNSFMSSHAQGEGGVHLSFRGHRIDLDDPGNERVSVGQWKPLAQEAEDPIRTEIRHARRRKPSCRLVERFASLSVFPKLGGEATGHSHPAQQFLLLNLELVRFQDALVAKGGEPFDLTRDIGCAQCAGCGFVSRNQPCSLSRICNERL